MRKLMLKVQYDGTDYAGFQIQPHAPTVQKQIQQALAAVLGEPTTIQAASRTDAGVHARGQIVAFETNNPIPTENLLVALNGRLPTAVNIAEGSEVTEQFNPRYDAVSKLYSYCILNRSDGSPFRERYAWHIDQPLDVGAMRAAAQPLRGQYNFSAFCAAGGSSTNMIRELYRLDIDRQGDTIEIYLEADGFLYKMIRNIVGTLVEVGLGRISLKVVQKILASRDRSQAGPTAPSCGLCLVNVSYQ